MQSRLLGVGLFVLTAILAAPGWAAEPELLASGRSPITLVEGTGGRVVTTLLMGGTSNSTVLTYLPHEPGTVVPIASNLRVTSAVGSAGGILLAANQLGFIPNRYLIVQADGSVLNRETHPLTAGDLTGFWIGQGGQVSFVGRHNSTTLYNVAYRDDPASQPHALELDISSILMPGEHLGTSTLVDSSGRAIIMRMFNAYRQDGDGWTLLPVAGSNLMDIAPDDRFICTSSLTNGRIFRSDMPFTPLIFTGGPMYYAAIADDGAIAVSAGSGSFFLTPDGNVIDLGQLAGPGNVPTGLISMNDQGEVAMLTTSGSSNKLWWFDRSQLHLIAEGLPLSYIPGSYNQQPLLLTSSREIYFYGLQPQGGSNVNLFRVQIPEPATVQILALLGVATAMHRRKKT